MPRLEGKVSIVTGGGDGIGRGICEVFAEEGARVAVLDWNAETGSRTAADVGGLFVHADISDEASGRQAVTQVASELGRPDVLVNNAAIFVFKTAHEATPDDWQRMFAVNVMGPALMVKHVVPHMRTAGGGAIVNIASVSAFVAQAGFLTYNTTKAAVTEMTRCMALDYVDDGIRVNGVCPGAVWTSQVEKMVAELGLTREEAGRRPNFGGMQIQKRIADPHEIGRVVAFLASSEASFMTGENVLVDGGWAAL